MGHRAGAMAGAAALTMCSACFAASAAQAPVLTVQDYDRASQMLPWNMRNLIKRLDFTAAWTGAGDTFMYRVEGVAGAEFFLVDPKTGEKKPAFNRESIAAALSKVSGTSLDAKALPINEYYRNYHQAAPFTRVNTSWKKDLSGFTVQLASGDYACTLASAACEATGKKLPAALGKVRLSPDKKLAAFHRDYNLYVYDVAAGKERALTTDGEEFYAYAKTSPGTQSVSMQRYHLTHPPVGVWSPDSTKILTHRFDQRRVESHHIVEASPADGGMRPKHYEYKYAIPSDPVVSTAELMIFDVASGKRIPIRMDPVPNPGVASLLELANAWWSADSKSFFVITGNRWQTMLALSVVDAETGAVRELVRESAEDGPVRLALGQGIHSIQTLGGGKEIVWFSERDGWSHLYLYDVASGKLKNRITSGKWLVHEAVRVDETRRLIYFLAAGKEPGRNPYYKHLYRAPLDGGKIELLTPEDADHAVSISPSTEFFTDTYSRVDQPPVTVLRQSTGKVVMKLEEADLSALTATGWKPPERFTVKAEDGVTDLYGIIVKPTNFDPKKRYPVVDAIYPAPGSRVPQTFAQFVDNTDHPQALPELGFIVVEIDGRGTLNRDRAFRNFVYRNYHDAGLGDHVAGIRQVAKDRPYMDLDRVGVYGHSNGGTNTLRAILNHPDFYKVAVASAASSDRRMHSTSWEATIGPYTKENGEAWRLQNLARPELVAGFKGHLLLVMGEVDDNVHPSQAMRLVAELVRQNKDFDFLMLPGRNHDFKPDSYFIRKRWDYFVRHLLGIEPPAGVKARGEDVFEHPPLLFRPSAG